MTEHRFKPETTNGGRCFADCACGWGGGVYWDRRLAREAWQAHCAGEAVPPPVRPTVLFGPRARGMGGGLGE